MKKFENYREEYLLLKDMFRCSSRYLHVTQKADAMKLERKFRSLYNKYAKRLDKKCKRKTGRSIYDADTEKDV